jgi:hypothetical protein
MAFPYDVDDERDRYAPGVGMAFGVIFGALVWAILLGLVWWWW